MNKGSMRIMAGDQLETWPITNIYLNTGRIYLEIRRPPGKAFVLDSGAVFTIFGEDGRALCQRAWNETDILVDEGRELVFTYSLTIATFVDS